MNMMDQSLVKLVKEGIVEQSEAMRRSVNIENFKMYMDEGATYPENLKMD